MLLDMLLGKRAADVSPDRDPTSGFWYGALGRGTKSGVNVTANVAMTYSAVWCATLRRVGTLAALPKNLYRRLPGKRTEIAKDRPEHWLLHRRANPTMKASAYHALMQEWRLNGGNAYAEIEWSRPIMDSRGKITSRAVALWPIHPSRCKVMDTEDGSVWYEVKNKNADPTYIQQKDMIHLPSLICPDGITGMGVVTSAREAIGFGIATERHGADLVGGGALPQIALEQATAVVKDTEQRQAFRKEWREIHGVGENTPAILPPGMTLKPLTFSMEDLQYLTTRQHNIEEMARWYDLPPHTLHHLLRMTNNNVEQLSIDVVKYSFLPWIVPDEEEYLLKLIPDEEEQRDYYFKYEVNGLLRGDSASRSAMYHNGIVDGWLSPNEVRELEDWNPYEGGDEYFIQGAMVRVDQVGMEPVAQPKPATEEDPDEEDEPEDDTKESALKSCARAMLTAAIGRMVDRESLAMKRLAAQKPGKFLEAAESFYAEHEAIVVDALTPILEACASLGVARIAAVEASAMCEQSQRELLEMTDRARAETLVAEVEALTAEWARTRAAAYVAKVAELN